MNNNRNKDLQRNSSAGLEGLGYKWVNIDIKVLGDGNFLVSFLDLLPNPIGKGLTGHGVHDVDDPLLRQFDDFFLNGEPGHDLIQKFGPFKDDFTGETVILRNMQMLGTVTLDIL